MLSFSGLSRRVTVFRVSALIFLISFCIRIGLVVYKGEYHEIYRRDESTVALAVLRGEGYANPYMVPTGPTAHYPPGHPAILIAIYKLFGTGITAEIVKHVWTCSVVSVLYALLPAAALALQLPAVAGIAAGLLGALLPLKYATETSGEWDTPEAAVLLVLLIMMSGRRRSVARAFGYGALWGIAFQFAPQLLPLAMAIIALELIRKANPVRHVAVTIAAAALVLLPWTIRNYRTMGSLFFVRDNFGLELALSNRPNAGLTVMDNFPEEERSVHPGTSRRECARILSMGEVAYHHLRLQEAKAWIAANPGEFARLTLRRISWFWFNKTDVLLKDLFYWILTLTSWCGLYLLHRRWRTESAARPDPLRVLSTPLLILTIWVVYPLVYYIIQGSTRYRYPIDWTFLLTTGYCAYLVAIRLARSRRLQRYALATTCLR